MGANPLVAGDLTWPVLLYVQKGLSLPSYVAPPALSDGELVVDLLAGIAESPQSDPTSAPTAKNDVLGSA
jgi:hypothetical protein